MESPIQLMTKPLKRYAEFSGRSRRMEYWMFYVGLIVAYLAALLIDSIIGYPVFIVLVGLGALIPTIACGVRRMHDGDRSGWWLLVPIAGFIFLFIEGTKGDNRFGPDPKAGVS